MDLSALKKLRADYLIAQQERRAEEESIRAWKPVWDSQHPEVIKREEPEDGVDDGSSPAKN